MNFIIGHAFKILSKKDDFYTKVCYFIQARKKKRIFCVKEDCSFFLEWGGGDNELFFTLVPKDLQ